MGHQESTRPAHLPVIDGFTVPDRIPPHNEGHTVAAWTAMIGVMLGVTITGVGIVLVNSAVWIAGIVVTVAALVAGVVLRSLGYGQRAGRR